MIRTLAASLVLLALAPAAGAQINGLGLPKPAATVANGAANAGSMTGCLAKIIGNASASGAMTYGFRFKALEVSNKSPVAVGELFTLNLSKDKMYVFFLSDPGGAGFPGTARDPSPGQWDQLIAILSSAPHVKVHFDWNNHIASTVQVGWDEPC